MCAAATGAVKPQLIRSMARRGKMEHVEVADF